VLPIRASNHRRALRRRARAVLGPMFVAALAAGVARAESIWVEGEDAVEQRVTAHPGWYDRVETDVLSEGRWLSHFDAEREGTAECRLRVENAGRFTLWLRANPVKSKLSYRVDGGDWKPVDFSGDVRGSLNIAADNKPDLRFIAWVKVGAVTLERGDHRLGLRFHSDNQHHGAVDCLVLTNDGFVPSGARKPSALRAAGPRDWFEVLPDDDPFSTDSLTDMSRLVEAPAGGYGFLRAVSDELRFERGSGAVKLWGIGSNLARRESPELMEQSARWYRKLGINLVRQHTVIADVGLLGADGFDPARIDRYDRWFATLARHGIYTCWSVIYPHHGAFLRASDGVRPEAFGELDRADSDRDGARQPIVTGDFINLDRELQDIALRYFRALLEHRNPYTGLRYRDDPALAILEFQNESNAFFHTLNGLRGDGFPYWSRHVRRGFFRFVESKYGSREATEKAWGRADRDDRWEAGELGLMAAYHWGDDGPLHEFRGQLRRCGDSIEFLAEMQRGYFARREREVRELGFRGVTVTTAWQGVGASSLANLWCDTAADMIDRHNYFGGGAGGHRIVAGEVDTATHLSQPGRGLLGVGLFQIASKPFAYSEWTQMPPNPWKAEAAPLIAFYGMGLQGWDMSCHFACSEPRWGDGWPELSKYAGATPHYFGQFPALAFAIHRGHLRAGDVVAARRVTRADLFSGVDPLRQSLARGGHDIKELGDDPVTPPAMLALGRVTIAIDEAGTGTGTGTGGAIDPRAAVLDATTGELRWRVHDRIVEVRSARTQAVIGFAGGREVSLPAVDVAVESEFCSLIFTPLDDEPLERSRSVLITALARDRQEGSRFSEDGKRLEAAGGPPLLLEPVVARVRLRGPPPERVRALDLYGVPRGDAVRVAPDGRFEIDGTHRTFLYHVAR